MGHGAVAGLTWLCYIITQPVGCPPVKCLLTLMNGCNMPHITTLQATHSLMASHNAEDAPSTPKQDSQRERGGGGVGNGSHEHVELVSVNKRITVSSSASFHKILASGALWMTGHKAEEILIVSVRHVFLAYRRLSICGTFTAIIGNV